MVWGMISASRWPRSDLILVTAVYLGPVSLVSATCLSHKVWVLVPWDTIVENVNPARSSSEWLSQALALLLLIKPLVHRQWASLFVLGRL